MLIGDWPVEFKCTKCGTTRDGRYYDRPDGTEMLCEECFIEQEGGIVGVE